MNAIVLDSLFYLLWEWFWIVSILLLVMGSFCEGISINVGRFRILNYPSMGIDLDGLDAWMCCNYYDLESTLLSGESNLKFIFTFEHYVVL